MSELPVYIFKGVGLKKDGRDCGIFGFKGTNSNDISVSSTAIDCGLMSQEQNPKAKVEGVYISGQELSKANRKISALQLVRSRRAQQGQQTIAL